MIRRPPRSTLFPYTTLFRSRLEKRIPLSEQVQAVLRVDSSELTSPELIRAILRAPVGLLFTGGIGDRKRTRLNSSHANILYAVFCLKKKKKTYLPSSFLAFY